MRVTLVSLFLCYLLLIELCDFVLRRVESVTKLLLFKWSGQTRYMGSESDFEKNNSIFMYYVDAAKGLEVYNLILAAPRGIIM